MLAVWYREKKTNEIVTPILFERVWALYNMRLRHVNCMSREKEVQNKFYGFIDSMKSGKLDYSHK